MVEIVIQPQSVFDIPGCDTLIVSCSATGAPLDSFTFSHQGTTLSDSSPGVNITITKETVGDLMVATATLTLCSVTSENSGGYECLASVANISDEATFTVKYYSLPVASEKCERGIPKCWSGCLYGSLRPWPAAGLPEW